MINDIKLFVNNLPYSLKSLIFKSHAFNYKLYNLPQLDNLSLSLPYYRYNLPKSLKTLYYDNMKSHHIRILLPNPNVCYTCSNSTHIPIVDIESIPEDTTSSNCIIM